MYAAAAAAAAAVEAATKARRAPTLAANFTALANERLLGGAHHINCGRSTYRCRADEGGGGATWT
jgi:hypothetical protein